jgi:hypothetical protein
MDIRTPEFVAVGSDAQRVHPDNATSGATFTRTAQPAREQDNCLVQLKIAIDTWLLLRFAIYVWTIPARFVQIYLAISVPRATRLDVNVTP